MLLRCLIASQNCYGHNINAGPENEHNPTWFIALQSPYQILLCPVIECTNETQGQPWDNLIHLAKLNPKPGGAMHWGAEWMAPAVSSMQRHSKVSRWAQQVQLLDGPHFPRIPGSDWLDIGFSPPLPEAASQPWLNLSTLTFCIASHGQNTKASLIPISQHHWEPQLRSSQLGANWNLRPSHPN